MNLLVENRIPPDLCIDDSYPPEKSIVLRYMNAIKFIDDHEEDMRYKELLKRISICEGARIFPLLTYRGVMIFILDETSLMHTKTLKSVDGCVSIAYCMLRGYDRIIFESGGNTGAAFTEYGQRAKLETFFFIPGDNTDLLDRKIFDKQGAHLIAVKDPSLVKRSAGLFRDITGFAHIPETLWRYQASMLRGLFILEHILTKGRFDWIAQTISAAFGPIGIYRILKRFKREIGALPGFLGIQQEANCPIYRAWKSGQGSNRHPVKPSFDQLLTRVMYDTQPHTYGSYDELSDLLKITGGDLTTVDRSEFDELIKRDLSGKDILRLLNDNDIEITLRHGKVVEKTGMIALAGTLKEIDRGTIAEGSRVLCCLTGGISTADGKAEPEFNIIDPETMVAEYAKKTMGTLSNVRLGSCI